MNPGNSNLVQIVANWLARDAAVAHSSQTINELEKRKAKTPQRCGGYFHGDGKTDVNQARRRGRRLER
jgi:hypothetical protein